MRRQTQKEQSPQDFARENWLGILSTVGTIAALSTILLIRYYKKKREAEGNLDEDLHLAALLTEAENSASDETSVLLETGGAVVSYIEGAPQLTDQLAMGLPEKLPEDLDPKLKKKFQKSRLRDTMKTLGRLG